MLHGSKTPRVSAVLKLSRAAATHQVEFLSPVANVQSFAGEARVSAENDCPLMPHADDCRRSASSCSPRACAVVRTSSSAAAVGGTSATGGGAAVATAG